MLGFPARSACRRCFLEALAGAPSGAGISQFYSAVQVVDNNGTPKGVITSPVRVAWPLFGMLTDYNYNDPVFIAISISSTGTTSINGESEICVKQYPEMFGFNIWTKTHTPGFPEYAFNYKKIQKDMKKNKLPTNKEFIDKFVKYIDNFN